MLIGVTKHSLAKTPNIEFTTLTTSIETLIILDLGLAVRELGRINRIYLGLGCQTWLLSLLSVIPRIL